MSRLAFPGLRTRIEPALWETLAQVTLKEEASQERNATEVSEGTCRH